MTAPWSLPTIAAAAAIAALALAGCAQPRTAAAEISLDALAGSGPAAAWSRLQPGAALVRLADPRDAAAALRERRPGASLVQEIVLGSGGAAGTNLVTLAVHAEPAQPALYPGKPSEAGIRSEIAAAFPGRPMRIVPQPRHNAYGPYGLAVAAGADGQRCIYAWQWLDDAAARATLGGAASWRVRICRAGQSLDAMAASLDALLLGAAPATLAQPGTPRPAPARQAAPRRLASLARPADPAPVDLAAAPLAAGRYLAPVPAAPRPQPAGGPPAMLDASLPAEAYRGPGGRGGAMGPVAPRDAAALRATLVPSPN